MTDEEFREGMPAGKATPSLSAEDLVALNEEIAAMARAGLPLDQGLAALAREMGGGRLRQVTQELANDLRAGQTLPEALARQGGRVPPFYAGLVAAGVRSGRIGDVLATLTTYARTLADLRVTIVNALVYPVVVILLALVLFAFIAGFLIPHFDRMFNDFKLRVPLATEVALELGRHPFEYVILPPLLLIALLLTIRFALRRTARGRMLWARWVYALPVAGTLVHSARLAAYTDLLAILVDHHVPLPEAFRLAGDASSDPLLTVGSRQAEQELARGQPLGEALRGIRQLPALLAWMAGLGERRGTLGATLHQVAAMYRRQAELRASLLRTVLPPFLIIMTAGVVVVLFVLAVFLPLISLIGVLEGVR